MTSRAFFESIQNGKVDDDVKAYAVAEIEKMNARNEKRATTPSKTAIANEPLKAQILAFLTEKTTSVLTSAIGEAVGISTAKASALLRQLANDGKIVGEEAKVTKSRKRMVWKIKAE